MVSRQRRPRTAKRSAVRPRVRRTPALAPAVPLAYNVSVADVMSRSPVSIGAKPSLHEALLLMRLHDVRGLPVVDEAGNVVGVLSQKDLARRLAVPVNLPEVKGLLDVLMVGLEAQPDAALARLVRALNETRVEEAMSRPPFVVRSDAPLELAMQVMAENSISRLPVVEGRRLVGIVTPTDLISAALRLPRSGR